MNEQMRNSSLMQDFQEGFRVQIVTEEKSGGDGEVEGTLDPVTTCWERLDKFLVTGIRNIRKWPNAEIKCDLRKCEKGGKQKAWNMSEDETMIWHILDLHEPAH